MFAFVRDLLRDAQARWSGKDKETLRSQLLEPLFKKLGFKPTVNRPSKTDQTQPDYLLRGASRERERPEAPRQRPQARRASASGTARRRRRSRSRRPAAGP